MPAALVARLDGWLRSEAAAALPQYTVRRPWQRRHALLLPEDGDAAGGGTGDVAAAVGAVVRALSPGLLTAGSALAELAAFVVAPGAEAQELHADRTERGFISCQLARPSRGALAPLSCNPLCVA